MGTKPTIEKVTGTLGAEISNIDIGSPLDDSTLEWLKHEFVENKVLFFRDQHLTSEQHVAFSGYFGDVLDVHPWSASKADFKNIMLIYNAAAAGWHSDETWREETPLGSVLYGRSVPEYGGDTVFADMERVYDDLSDDVQENLDGLYAVHDHISHRRRMRAIGKSEEQIDAWRREFPEVRHPIVRTHPVTGRKSLFVNGGFTDRVDGMDADESKELLASLYALVAKPQYQCRFRWQTRSVAFWDNRSVQHYGVPDFGDQERLMERVTIGGDRPT